MDNPFIKKIQALMETVPYIQRYKGAVLVIKYGGHAMIDDELKEKFAQDIVLLKCLGMNPIIIHGGGPQIGHFLKRLSIKSEFIDGMRVTDKQTMEVVEMVLAGKVNKEIVTLIHRNGGRAVGLSGKDGGLIMAKKMKLQKAMGDNQPPALIDLGMVGEVSSVDHRILLSFLENDLIPIIAPVGAGENGETYNINADIVAGQVAASMNARKFILLTDTEGVLGKDGEKISILRVNDIPALVEDRTIQGGMIPKVHCCLDAITGGVEKAHIIDGRKDHTILWEIFTEKGTGTEITK